MIIDLSIINYLCLFKAVLFLRIFTTLIPFFFIQSTRAFRTEKFNLGLGKRTFCTNIFHSMFLTILGKIKVEKLN